MILRGSKRQSERNEALRDRLWRHGLDFLCRAQGATAIEFALISPFVILTMVVIISIGYIVFMNQALDYATGKAARLIRTGQTQQAGISTASAFVTQELCPLLPSFFDCSQLIVYAQSLPANVWMQFNYPYNIYTGYFNSTNSGLIASGLATNQQFCPGSGGQNVYLQIQYPANFFTSLLSAGAITYNGQQVYMLQSTAVFLNEPFAAVGAC